MPLILGGVVLVLFAVLSLSASQGAEGRKNAINTVMGTFLVSALVFVFVRSGMPWLGVLVLFGSIARRFLLTRSQVSPDSSAPRPAEPPRSRASVSTEMTRDEAYAILGLQAGATESAILEAYKRLMKKVHPDQGGSTYLAQRINLARDVLVSK